MKLSHLLLLTGVLAASSPAFAAEELEPVTVSVNSTTGSFTAFNGAKNWASNWKSTAATGVNLNSGANNFKVDVTGDLEYFVGSSSPSTVTITSTDNRYYVSGYAFNYKLVESGTDVNVKPNGATSATKATDAYQAVKVENLDENATAAVVFSGGNKGVVLNEFTVTLTPASNDYDMLTGNIVNGQFDEWTPWFNLQMTTGAFSIYADGENQIDVNGTHAGFQAAEDHQWTFVAQADGTYKIYNRSLGTSKVLAAPKTGGNNTDYPRMMSEGNADYCYTWNVIPASATSGGTAIDGSFNGKYPFFLQLSSNKSSVLNNFSGNGKLTFWTGGYDNGSVFVPVLVEGKFKVDLDHGYLTRNNQIDNTSAWQNPWHLWGNFGMTFGTGANNITTTTGKPTEGNLQLASGQTSGGSSSYTFIFPDTDYYISDIAFSAHTAGENGQATLVFNGEECKLAGTTPVAFSLSGLAEDSSTSIFLTAENSTPHNVVVADMVVSVKRYDRPFVAPTTIFVKQGHPQRRIPALAVTGKSGRLIAVYDYRWCGGDLGGGNIDLQIATSDDNGLTWTEPDFARDAQGNPVTEYNHAWTKGSDWSDVQKKATEAWDAAWGDAAICGDRESDRVMMIAVGGPTGFWGSTRNNPQSAIRWISEDGGKTWSAPENITEKIYSLFDGEPTHGKIDGMFFGSGRVAQSRHIKVGKYYRMYSVISTNNGGATRNFVLYTDDMGETWNVLGGNDSPAVTTNADEPKAEELPDGSVLLAARGKGGNRNFNIFRYTNPTIGAGRWDSPINTDLGMGNINACDGEIYILPVRNVETQEQCFMALQSFPFGGGRNLVSIAWKPLAAGEDFDTPADFRTWGGRYQVSRTGSAYTTMVLNHEGNMSFFYEEQLTGVYDGVYKTLPIELITNGRYEYCPDANNAVAQQLTKSLVEYRMENFAGADKSAVNAAGNAYLANPTYANYIAFNRAEYDYLDDEDDYDFDYTLPMWPGLGVQVEAIAVDPATAELEVGETATLTVSHTPANAEVEGTVTWTSSDEAVATVDETGLVTALAEGTAVITATLGELTATCVITVTGVKDSISEISADAANVQLFDLTGRKIAKAARGQVYITSDHHKVIVK